MTDHEAPSGRVAVFGTGAVVVAAFGGLLALGSAVVGLATLDPGDGPSVLSGLLAATGGVSAFLALAFGYLGREGRADPAP